MEFLHHFLMDFLGGGLITNILLLVLVWIQYKILSKMGNRT